MLAMQEKAVPEKNVYVDKQSVKDHDRPVYNKMLRKLKRD